MVVMSVDVIIDTAENLPLAPLESIFHDGSDAKPFVFVRTAAGFEKREIEVGLTNNIKAAVRSGLKAGEVIALERPGAGGGSDTRSAQNRPGAARCPDACRMREISLGVLDV